MFVATKNCEGCRIQKHATLSHTLNIRMHAHVALLIYMYYYFDSFTYHSSILDERGKKDNINLVGESL